MDPRTGLPLCEGPARAFNLVLLHAVRLSYTVENCTSRSSDKNDAFEFAANVTTNLAKAFWTLQNAEGIHDVAILEPSRSVYHGLQYTYEDYTGGWISVLTIELNAPESLFDKKHDDLLAINKNTYTLGRMKGTTL